MSHLRCPYCPSPTGRCAATAAGRSITSCSSCGRAIQERQTHTHPLFLLRAHDTSLPVVTPDLLPLSPPPSSDDPFHPTGFITAFSTWSLEPSPVFARSTSSFAGHLAELERALDADGVKADPSGPKVSVEHLRAYLQILDVGSILGLEHAIADHAFQLFRDCSSATCLRNRNVEALATAALVQAIREAQEPRTLQEISAASKLPQKEIGKYIKILGESLQLSQPINSNSIAVHMPRFCTLLQLNKSAQELAAHIGEVVVNKCFCTRRNPISISAAAIYLACQLEDKRKTQAEICKVTGLTEVTLRKVYKELLENWDDLLPPNYTPAVPPEKAFPTTAITSGRSSTPKVDVYETSHLSTHQDKEKHLECKRTIIDLDAMEIDHPVMTSESSFHSRSQSLDTMDLNKEAVWQQQIQLGIDVLKPSREKETKDDHAMTFEETKSISGCMQKAAKSPCTARIGQAPTFSNLWQTNVSRPSYVHSGKQQTGSDTLPEIRRDVNQREADNVGRCHDTD